MLNNSIVTATSLHHTLIALEIDTATSQGKLTERGGEKEREREKERESIHVHKELEKSKKSKRVNEWKKILNNYIWKGGRERERER